MDLIVVRNDRIYGVVSCDNATLLLALIAHKTFRIETNMPNPAPYNSNLCRYKPAIRLSHACETLLD